MENLLPIGQVREAHMRRDLLEEVQEECDTTGCVLPIIFLTFSM